MGNEQQEAARRDLSVLMREMRGWSPERAAQAVWEWMGAQGFEQAHTPTDDERDELELQDLATVIGNVVIDYEDTGPHSQRPITIRDACADLPMEIAGEVRAAGFRRTVQGEPTDDEREAIIDALLDELGWEWDEVPEEHIPSSREILGDMADRALAVTAGFRRPVQGEPTDAQVLAALNAQWRTEREQAKGETEWEYSWGGDDWVLDAWFDTEVEARDAAKRMPWMDAQRGKLVRRRKAGPWVPVEQEGENR